MRILVFIGLSILFTACSNITSDPGKELKQEISKLETMDTSAVLLKEKYQSFYTQFPKDSMSSKYLLETARYYQSETENYDSARLLAKKVFTDFPDSKSAPEAMIMFATLQKEISEFAHWSKMTQKKYPSTKAGEDALINLAIQYENKKMNEEAIQYYGEYLAIYPEGRHKEAAEFGIKFTGKLDDFLKEVEKKN